MNIQTQTKHILVWWLNIIVNSTPFFIGRGLLKFLGNKIGYHTYIHGSVRLFSIRNLQIGNNCTINFGCFLDNRCKIEIGNNVMLGHNSKIYSLSHDINCKDFKALEGPIKIKDNCVIFPNCLIMPNSILEEGTVLLPGAVFSGKSEKYCIYGGVPAKLKSKRNKVIDYKLKYDYYFAN